MFAILSWLVLRWARQHTERQELIDIAIERGIDLDDERRPGRAVNAGRAAGLRERPLASTDARTPKPS